MNDKDRARTLLIEAHSAIANASRDAVSKIGAPLQVKSGKANRSKSGPLEPRLMAAIHDAVAKMTLNYPPERQVLTSREERALRSLKLPATERSALRKLIAEACHSTMFRFFCLMDAVADPDVVDCRTWLGARFAARQEGPMLHDEFGELYWKYKDARALDASLKKKRTVKARLKRKRRHPK